MKHFYDSIHGWFAFKHLYEKVAASIPDGSTLVEVGSWQGRSLAYLAVELVNRGKLDCKLVAIDKWMGSPGDGLKLTESMRPSFEANMKRGGFFLRDVFPLSPLESSDGPIINILERDSAEAASLAGDGSVDYLMIDGAHDYQSVRKDVLAWLPKMAEGGLMSGDDYNKQWPGVILGVRDIIPRCRLRLWPNAEASSDSRQDWQHTVEPWVIGEWQRDELDTHPEFRAVFFLPYVKGIELLEKAVTSLGRAWQRTIVIDQSEGGLRDKDGRFPDWLNVASILRVPYRSLSFAQLQNWMQHYARFLRIPTFFFMHADAEVLDPYVLTDCLAKLEHPQVAACFTNYDSLIAFDTAKLARVGCWDESFEWYHADVDYYRRIRLAGFTMAEAGGARVKHTPSSTINTDPTMKARVDQLAKHMESHYHHKWGGHRGQEKHSVPYNGKP